MNIKALINGLIQKTGYQFISTTAVHADPIIDKDETFLDIYRRIQPYTMTSRKQCFALYTAVNYIIDANIPGDFVECGVWKGGNAMLIAYTLQAKQVTDRTIFLYDTFAGMTEPGVHDTLLTSSENTHDTWTRQQQTDHNTWCYASLEAVTENLHSTHYPNTKLVFVEGMVEETIPKTIPKTIALLRLDTDWYDSTKHELEQLYPLVSTGGVLVLDDYGSWAGAKKATDEYFLDQPVLLAPIDKNVRLVIKTQHSSTHSGA